MTNRADFKTDATGYFDGLDPDVRGTALAVRKLVLAAVPGIAETIKWGLPVYEHGKLVCAIRCTNSYVALQLHHGAIDLDDPEHLLEGTGTTMRHVKMRTQDDIRSDVLTSWIRQIAAAALP